MLRDKGYDTLWNKGNVNTSQISLQKHYAVLVYNKCFFKDTRVQSLLL
jgi:hypothetical protein